MFCINCGKELRDTAKFCPFCGNAVEPKEASPVPETVVHEEAVSEMEIPETEVHEEAVPETEVPETEVHEEAVPNTKSKAGFSENFDEKDGLFVMRSSTPEPAVQTEIPVKKKKSPVKKVFAVIAAIAVVGACSYAVPAFVVPAMKYNIAVSQYQNGEFAVASSAFSALGTYKNSGEYVLKCRYGEAEKLLVNGRYTEAAAVFSGLDGFADSDSRSEECMLALAEDYINKADYASALEIYANLNDKELAAQKISAFAEKMTESGDYLYAAQVAADYLNDGEAAVEYQYQGALAAMQEGDYKTAMSVFPTESDYKDSASLAQECTYLYYTAEYKENGASEEIARAFCFLGDFRDSEEMFKTVSYEYGMTCADKGDYAAAAAMFKNAGSYRGAENELNRARYELGKSLMGPDPASARSVFALLSTYSDSAEQKKAAASRVADSHENWYADGYASVDGYYTTVFSTDDNLTVYCTAGTDSISQPVTLTLTLRDSAGNEISADCENIRNSGTFTGSFSLASAEPGDAEIIISRKDNGAVLRTINISITD